MPAIEPADLRAALAAPSSAVAAAAAPLSVPTAAGLPASPAADRTAVLAGISASYFRLRRGLAVLALAFPPVLWLGSGAPALPGSISAFYHIPGHGYGGGALRDVFVGVLWTIGAFLFFYKGYSAAENRALNVAGAAAAVIALSPMDWPPGSPATWRGDLHDGSAVVFFLCIAYVCLRCSNNTLTLLDAVRRRAFTRMYRVLGTLMVVLPLGVAGVHALLGRAAPDRMVLGIEVAAIDVFAAFWLVKSREIALIERG